MLFMLKCLSDILEYGNLILEMSSSFNCYSLLSFIFSCKSLKPFGNNRHALSQDICFCVITADWLLCVCVWGVYVLTVKTAKYNLCFAAVGTS